MSGVLAIDLGASSGRAIISKIIDQKIEMKEINRFTGYIVETKNGIYIDVELLFEHIIESLQIAIEQEVIVSVGIDTWGVDFGLLNEKGQLVQNPFHYRDMRFKTSMNHLQDILEQQEVFNHTGIQLMEINSLFQLLEIKQNQPDVYESAKSLLMLPDLLNYMLTGKQFNERSIASTSQLYNPEEQNWDYELIEKVGLKAEMFNEIIPPGKVIGLLKEELQEKYSLPPLSICAVGSHDTASAVLCTPNSLSNLFISSGTWSLVGVNINQPIINDQVREHNLSNETGVYQITLLKNLTGLWLIQESQKAFEREGKSYTFQQINDLAKKAKDIDYYFDTSLTQFSVPGNIPKRIQLHARNSNQEVPETAGEIFRVIYTNLALQYRQALESLEEVVNNQFETAMVVGGGSRADYLLQCTANTLGIPITAGFPEATALGNSIVQLLSSNSELSEDELRQLLSNSSQMAIYQPGNVSAWDEKYSKYKKKIIQ